MNLEYVLRNKIKKNNNKNNNKTKVLGNKIRREIQRSRNSQQNWIMQITEYEAIELFHLI